MIFVCINTFSIGAHRRSSCPCSMSCRGETHFLPLQHCHKFALLHNFETFGFLVTLKFTSIYNHTLFFCRETAMSVYQILGMDSCLGYIYCRVMINTPFGIFVFVYGFLYVYPVPADWLVLYYLCFFKLLWRSHYGCQIF